MTLAAGDRVTANFHRDGDVFSVTNHVVEDVTENGVQLQDHPEPAVMLDPEYCQYVKDDGNQCGSRTDDTYCHVHTEDD